jgi:hypothetical protein
MPEADADLRPVVLLSVPVVLYRQAQERHEELMRELALVDLSTSDNLPRRLLDMVAEIRRSYGRFTQAQQGHLAQAIARGDQTIDLHFTVPAAVAQAAADFLAVLEESDEFCRNGDLLVLEVTPALYRLRHWYFGQFIAQIAGEPPTPWREDDGAS